MIQIKVGYMLKFSPKIRLGMLIKNMYLISDLANKNSRTEHETNLVTEQLKSSQSEIAKHNMDIFNNTEQQNLITSKCIYSLFTCLKQNGFFSAKQTILKVFLNCSDWLKKAKAFEKLFYCFDWLRRPSKKITFVLNIICKPETD